MPANETGVDSAVLQIDAGVIFGDQSNYLCVPFSRFGLSNDAKIEKIHSSCECLKPSVVRYSTSSASTTTAVMIRFVHDSGPEVGMRVPTELGVAVSLTTVDGDTRNGIINFLLVSGSENTRGTSASNDTFSPYRADSGQ